MTPAETIEKIVEDTAERILRAIEDERCINKSSLVREVRAAFEAARTADIMARMRSDLLGPVGGLYEMSVFS